jgi:hypothetical protein
VHRARLMAKMRAPFQSLCCWLRGSKWHWNWRWALARTELIGPKVQYLNGSKVPITNIP